MEQESGGGQSGQESTQHWYDLPGGTEARADEWSVVERGEAYLEKTYAKLAQGEQLPLIQLLAALSLAFGVANMKEVFLATVLFIPPWYFKGDGFDGMISALSGIQLFKKKYTTMAFPTLLESYKLMRDFTGQKTVTKAGLVKAACFLAGWLAARYRYV